MFDDYTKELTSKGADLFRIQPTQGNIRGGLSTIEEKALGNIQKAGKSPMVDVLEYAEEPTKKGLNFMNSSSAAAECVTLFAAAGAVVHVFPPGRVTLSEIPSNQSSNSPQSENRPNDVPTHRSRRVGLAAARNQSEGGWGSTCTSC